MAYHVMMKVCHDGQMSAFYLSPSLRMTHSRFQMFVPRYVWSVPKNELEIWVSLSVNLYIWIPYNTIHALKFINATVVVIFLALEFFWVKFHYHSVSTAMCWFLSDASGNVPMNPTTKSRKRSVCLRTMPFLAHVKHLHLVWYTLLAMIAR